MNHVETPITSQEMDQLNAQITQVQQAIAKLEDYLRVVEAEIETFATDQERYNTLQDACNALDRLEELGAGDIFWNGLAKAADANEHGERLRSRIAAFKDRTRETLEKRDSLQEHIAEKQNTLYCLFDEVEELRLLEEQRRDEFVVEREMSPEPFRPMLMPWTKNSESDRRFRRTVLVSLAFCLFFGTTIPLVTLPILDRAEVVEVPERLAMLIKETPPVEPPPVQVAEKKPEKMEEKKPEEVAKAEKTPTQKPAAPKAAGDVKRKAKQKASNVGVLAFKSSFDDLMDEVPVAKLGAEARLQKSANKIPGKAKAQRSLVAIQAQGGGSGGIGNYKVSQDLGNGGKGGKSGYGNAGAIGGVGTEKVASSVAGLMEEAGRPLSGDYGSGRTDEEIQIVFDRYKATLYRIYNKELRKDPTLRGKLLLKLVIEANGEVSLCKMESTDLDSPELVAKIVARVKKFNFGSKDVQQITILYPIDFLPAG
ncbi:AgmX/PglI C-terminal domain-containing protein [Desulfosediminicola ganghwensis]|uniref:AgmX/PglI C-terminal domain-containing protein n=1 Tax=Desulfosediminicola ganghwensis TaxID=2569540 RepID=UPI0010ACD4D8|nr:AgmX/PglI C-terminal domain-containing protein [Desulfosediminicola ganghwensis]